MTDDQERPAVTNLEKAAEAEVQPKRVTLTVEFPQGACANVHLTGDGESRQFFVGITADGPGSVVSIEDTKPENGPDAGILLWNEVEGVVEEWQGEKVLDRRDLNTSWFKKPLNPDD